MINTNSSERVCFHVEGGETFDLAKTIPLSIESLHNNRPLFMAPSFNHWYPFHLSDRTNYRILQVKFIPPATRIFTNFKEFYSLFDYLEDHDDGNNYVPTEAGQKLIDEGYYCWELVKENDKEELPEIILWSPKNFVLDICEIMKVIK